MKYILLSLLFLPFTCFAQYHADDGSFTMWIETDCPQYILRTLAEHEGSLTDTCEPLLPKGEKAIYIMKEPYFKNMPDTFKGYHFYYIDPYSDPRYWYKRQKEEHIHIYYFSKMFNHVEYYQFWIVPIEMKKKKVSYGTNGYKCFFYFRQDLSKYEFLKAECTDWSKPENTSLMEFR